MICLNSCKLKTAMFSHQVNFIDFQQLDTAVDDEIIKTLEFLESLFLDLSTFDLIMLKYQFAKLSALKYKFAFHHT